MMNVIGGNQALNDSCCALSLVRNNGGNHAYLILEMIEDGVRKTMKAHLLIKENSDDKKATIVHGPVSIDELVGMQAAGLNSFTWGISRLQARAFVALVEAERERGDNDEIDYVIPGKTSIGGSCGRSLESLGAERSTQRSEEYLDRFKARYPDCSAVQISVVSLDSLLREGHNCLTWAESMIKALQLPYCDRLGHVFAANPKMTIVGCHDADAMSQSACCLL